MATEQAASVWLVPAMYSQAGDLGVCDRRSGFGAGLLPGTLIFRCQQFLLRMHLVPCTSYKGDLAGAYSSSPPVVHCLFALLKSMVSHNTINHFLRRERITVPRRSAVSLLTLPTGTLLLLFVSTKMSSSNYFVSSTGSSYKSD